MADFTFYLTRAIFSLSLMRPSLRITRIWEVLNNFLKRETTSAPSELKFLSLYSLINLWAVFNTFFVNSIKVTA